MSRAPLRRIKLWSPELAADRRADGTVIVWRKDPLGAYPHRITDKLEEWAERTPDTIWLAQRGKSGGWRSVTYGEALATARSIGQALLDLGLSLERPLAILSGNDIEHALMALGAQWAGIPSAAISTAYSLLSHDHGKLRDVAEQLTPGLVFAADGASYEAAITSAFPGTSVANVDNLLPSAFHWRELAETAATAAVDAAHSATGPGTTVKFLFTSGTTGSPKAVIQTNETIGSNQAMIADCYAFMEETPPVVVDWAPWSHTASGTKVFYMVLFNGGTYYIDEGKPTADHFEVSLRNLREIAPTWYFNVPAGFDMLVRAMEQDDTLRDNFFRRLQYLMYAGAAMAQHTWEAIERLAVASTGERVLRSATWGATETGPFALCSTEDRVRPDNVGIPAQGVTMKFVPDNDRYEVRIRGPSITPGYWRNPELTAAAFDEEGFYRSGDAMRFAVDGDPSQGFFFAGRLAENFKLRTGTFVAVGPLRTRLVNELGGLIRDAVLTGEGRDALGALLLPAFPVLRRVVPDEDLDDAGVLGHPEVRAALASALARHAAAASGSSGRVVRAMFLTVPPSLDEGEITDKGSLNQRRMLRNHPDLVEALYDDRDPRVILADPGAA